MLKTDLFITPYALNFISVQACLMIQYHLKPKRNNLLIDFFNVTITANNIVE